MADSSWSVLVPAQHLPEVGEVMARGGDWAVEVPAARTFVRDALLGILERNILAADQALKDARMCGDNVDPRLLGEIRQNVALASKILGVSVASTARPPVGGPDGGRQVDAGRREVLAALEAVASTVPGDVGSP